ncbi:hypothetical protein [Citrobacter arsenatis]|uniref:hypothetical protein n=1 Tax=Citrobacter arsenatis TaxID=2546350 RepID=UPI00300DC034
MSYPEDQNEPQPKPSEPEISFLDNYEQEIMARVPFEGLEMMTESFYKEKDVLPKKD